MPIPAVTIDGQRKDPEAASVSVFDRGFQYGDGVFETLAVVGGRVRELEAHMDRLGEGAELLGIPAPDAGDLAADIDDLAGELGTDTNAVIKVLYSRGRGGRGLAPPERPKPTRVIMRLAWPDHPPGWWRHGIRTITCTTHQVSGGALDGRIKSMNQINHIVARMEWQDPGVAEGLLCDQRGYVVEGTVTNVFAVFDGRVVTPDLTGSGLPGITRRRVLEIADEPNGRSQLAALSPADLGEADELFLTNSLVGIWPVASFDDRPFSAPGPVTHKLQQALEAIYA
ncbi:aminodeoxychorismate lyase [Thiohalorhabdus sp.]|uniref:aminodeoxychorismate lyase n=1 Tax=Thiohalorhabdus sp. TaxID=3094134 RepID=UPI002FC35C2D